MKIGESKCLSNNVIDKSRWGGLTIIRGVGLRRRENERC